MFALAACAPLWVPRATALTTGEPVPSSPAAVVLPAVAPPRPVHARAAEPSAPTAVPAGSAPTLRAASAEAAGDILGLYLQAIDLRNAGQHEPAVAALEHARQLAPDDPDLALELARGYAAAGWYGHAAAAFAEATTLAPGRADIALAQASFHLDRAFRVRVAVKAAERAAALNPGDPEAIRLLDRARAAATLAS